MKTSPINKVRDMYEETADSYAQMMDAVYLEAVKEQT